MSTTLVIYQIPSFWIQYFRLLFRRIARHCLVVYVLNKSEHVALVEFISCRVCRKMSRNNFKICFQIFTTCWIFDCIPKKIFFTLPQFVMNDFFKICYIWIQIYDKKINSVTYHNIFFFKSTNTFALKNDFVADQCKPNLYIWWVQSGFNMNEHSLSKHFFLGRMLINIKST